MDVFYPYSILQITYAQPPEWADVISDIHTAHTIDGSTLWVLMIPAGAKPTRLSQCSFVDAEIIGHDNRLLVSKTLEAGGLWCYHILTPGKSDNQYYKIQIEGNILPGIPEMTEGIEKKDIDTHDQYAIPEKHNDPLSFVPYGKKYLDSLLFIPDSDRSFSRASDTIQVYMFRRYKERRALVLEQDSPPMEERKSKRFPLSRLPVNGSYFCLVPYTRFPSTLEAGFYLWIRKHYDRPVRQTTDHLGLQLPLP